MCPFRARRWPHSRLRNSRRAGTPTIGSSFETCELAPLLQEMITTLKPAAERNSNQMVLNIADNVGSMFVDVTKLRQILFNLLSNAT